jgi:hypothetical protein
MNIYTLGIKYMVQTTVLPDERLDIGGNAYSIISSIAQKVSTLVFNNTHESLNTLLQPLYAFLDEHNKDILAANTIKYFDNDEFLLLGKMLNYYTSIHLYETEKALHSMYKAVELESPCLTQTQDECGTTNRPVHIPPVAMPGGPLTPFTATKTARLPDPNATCRWSKSKKRCVPRMQADQCSRHTTKATCMPDKVEKHSLLNKITRKSKKREIARAGDDMCHWDTTFNRCEVRNITKVRMYDKLAAHETNRHIRVYDFLKHLFTYTMRVSHLTLEQALDFTVSDGVMYCEETAYILNFVNTARPDQTSVHIPNPNQKIYLVHIA